MAMTDSTAAREGEGKRKAPAAAPGAIALAANLALFVIAAIALLVPVNYFAMKPALRWSADATKTRAYSLSDQTTKMLGRLEGDWTIAMVLVESDIADEAVLRQVREVLDRFEEASPHVRVLRIDPTRPEDLTAYDSLLAQVQARYTNELRSYDEALDAGTNAFKALIASAGQHLPSIQSLVAALPQGDPLRAQASQPLGLFTILAQEGDKVIVEIDKARATDASSPIADHETAAAILASALPQWANELNELAGLLRAMAASQSLDASQQGRARAAVEPLETLARGLAVAGDAVKRLPPLELSSIGRQLREGETVLVMGPPGATTVPARQLFPRTNLREAESGQIVFDRRFRGEQVIAAAMQSLVVKNLPQVVFVHAEDGPLLAPRPRQVDAVGITQVLRASRIGVVEWRPGDRNSERPRAKDGQPMVWVIVPPPQRTSIETLPAEAALIEAARTLLADGEPVLLNVFPSLLPRYGQKDPWADLLADWGVGLRTDRVIAEQQAGSDGTVQTQRIAMLNTFPSEHPLARTIDGQQLLFNLPTVISVTKDAPAGVTRRDVVAAVEPGERRWLDREWMSSTTVAAPPPAEDVMTAPAPIVVALERTNPHTSRPQRVLLTSGGGWMLSYIADITMEAAGRITLVNPGNVELMQSGVAWLAGMDELIAQGTAGREVARLRNVTPAARTRWGWLLMGAVPVGLLLLGGAVWFARRR